MKHPKIQEKKWQIDAKYVPNECKVKLPEDKKDIINIHVQMKQAEKDFYGGMKS